MSIAGERITVRKCLCYLNIERNSSSVSFGAAQLRSETTFHSRLETQELYRNSNMQSVTVRR